MQPEDRLRGSIVMFDQLQLDRLWDSHIKEQDNLQWEVK